MRFYTLIPDQPTREEIVSYAAYQSSLSPSIIYSNPRTEEASPSSGLFFAGLCLLVISRRGKNNLRNISDSRYV
jgi:hypothetical protein